jgi:hypothetical protein
MWTDPQKLDIKSNSKGSASCPNTAKTLS